MKNKRKLLLLFMFLLLPVTLNYFSPYVIIDGLANSLLTCAFFIWLVMFVSSLFFGRAFCSYVCPYGGLQMVVDSAVQKPLKQVKWLRIVRIILGILWVTPIVILLAVNINSMKINLLYLTETFISVDNIIKLIGYYVIVFALMLMPLFLGRRASCHYLCPMSILNVTGTKLRNVLNITSLRLTSVSEKCIGCKQCNKVCPMSLDVMGMVKSNNMDSLDCILCGECCKTCKSGVLKRKVCAKPANIDKSIPEQC